MTWWTYVPENFSSHLIETPCICGEREVMSHLYYCDFLSENKSEKVLFERIYNGNLSEQIKVYNRFEENMEVRERIKNQCENTQLKERKRQKTDSPCDPLVDPLVCNQPSFG